VDSRIEKEWICYGHQCLAKVTDMGHRCGYVGVNAYHPLYGTEYGSKNVFLQSRLDELKQSSIGKRGILSVFAWKGDRVTPELFFSVHGGITFSGTMKTHSNLWFFGFDCAHFGDAPDPALVTNPLRLPSLYQTGTVRTLLFVENECNDLARQLDEILLGLVWIKDEVAL
jgi:hypothetical protein